MITAQKVRDLTIKESSEHSDRTFLSAASGLVLFENSLYVIADDELHLGIFPIESDPPGILQRLLPGTLPEMKKERKKKKPDFEALVLLPKSIFFETEMLLAVPSGSNENRVLGVFAEIPKPTRATDRVSNPTAVRASTATVAVNAKTVDFKPIYEKLTQEFSELNIEGGVVSGNMLKLFQRGNGSKNENAIVDLRWPEFICAAKENQLRPDLIQNITRYELGGLNGVPLSFTDGATLPDGSTLFIAAAENTQDTYNDGACAGSVLGIIDPNGKILRTEAIPPILKAEGVCVVSSAQDLVQGYFVTDADDPAIPSELYSFTFAMPE